jgi:hypothetical protein
MKKMMGLALALATAGTAAHATAYATMPPVSDYLMDRGAEIAMARSAAPPAISDAATVMVLGRKGYETAAKGTNGWVCLVERGWMAPFDHAEFWNAKTKGPDCYNPAAARSVLPTMLNRASMIMAGEPKAKVEAAIKASTAGKTPEAGAVAYMMSRQQYLGDGGKSWMPHLMFFTPKSDAGAWGANAQGSPFIVDTSHTQVPEPWTIVMISAGHWSDGAAFTPTAAHHH